MYQIVIMAMITAATHKMTMTAICLDVGPPPLLDDDPFLVSGAFEPGVISVDVGNNMVDLTVLVVAAVVIVRLIAEINETKL